MNGLSAQVGYKARQSHVNTPPILLLGKTVYKTQEDLPSLNSYGNWKSYPTLYTTFNDTVLTNEKYHSFFPTGTTPLVMSYHMVCLSANGVPAMLEEAGQSQPAFLFRAWDSATCQTWRRKMWNKVCAPLLSWAPRQHPLAYLQRKLETGSVVPWESLCTSQRWGRRGWDKCDMVWQGVSAWVPEGLEEKKSFVRVLGADPSGEDLPLCYH